MIDAMAFDEFARRAEQEPDLELGWEYWNWLLPTTTGVALLMLFIMPMLRDATRPSRSQPMESEREADALRPDDCLARRPMEPKPTPPEEALYREREKRILRLWFKLSGAEQQRLLTRLSAGVTPPRAPEPHEQFSVEALRRELDVLDAIAVNDSQYSRGMRCSTDHLRDWLTDCGCDDPAAARDGWLNSEGPLNTAPRPPADRRRPDILAFNIAVDGDNDMRAAWLLDHEAEIRAWLCQVAVAP